MTAEIAILNKLAVALAADSAVSIGKAPNLKIYNTVNKIFELSGHHPVGIMVYGRLIGGICLDQTKALFPVGT